MKKVLLIIATIFVFANCSVIEQLGGAMKLAQCDFKYKSIEEMQIAGIEIGGTNALSLSNFAKISTILTGGNLQTIPLNFTLNMNVINPNNYTAFLNAVDYSIEINEMEFTKGKIDVPIRIESQQTAVLPISIGVDLKNLMNRYSKQRVASEIGSLLGISSEKTKITVRLWPKMMIGNATVKIPTAIPVVFTFGGNDSM